MSNTQCKYEYWSKLDSWTLCQAACILSGEEPDKNSDLTSDMAKAISTRLMQSALLKEIQFTSSKIGLLFKPEAVISWANKVDRINVDKKLSQAVSQAVLDAENIYSIKKDRAAEYIQKLDHAASKKRLKGLSLDSLFKSRKVNKVDSREDGLGLQSNSNENSNEAVKDENAELNNILDQSSWKMRVQVEAARRFLSLRKAKANPTKLGVSKDLANWCIENDIRTKTGLHPAASYIYKHVLRPWTPPQNKAT